MIRKSLFLFLLLTSFVTSQAYAGLYGFTMHSRANCHNNESISWWWQHPLYLKTLSAHYDAGRLAHVVETPWETTWRSAAVHWWEGEYTRNWSVIGYHYGVNGRGDAVLLQSEAVDDCSIYDGWWDK